MFTRVIQKLFSLAISIYRARAGTRGETFLGVNETKFIEIFDNIFLEKINNIPTRENNVLGLLITSIPDKIKISEVLKPTDVGIFTDHSLIMFDLITACNPLTKRSVFNYRRADFDGLRAHFRSLKFEEKITEYCDISKDWSDSIVSCSCEALCSYCEFKRSTVSPLVE